MATEWKVTETREGIEYIDKEQLRTAIGCSSNAIETKARSNPPLIKGLVQDKRGGRMLFPLTEAQEVYALWEQTKRDHRSSGKDDYHRHKGAVTAWNHALQKRAGVYRVKTENASAVPDSASDRLTRLEQRIERLEEMLR